MWIVIGILFVLGGGYLMYSVIIKKFPQLKLIDLSTLAKERHAQVKSRIMKDRFDRTMGEMKTKASFRAAGVKGRLGRFYEGVYGRLKRMEERYDEEQPPRPAVRDAKIQKLLAAAVKAIEENCTEDAEKTYIEILRLDPHHIETYRGLADLYIETRSYDQAKEVLEFLLKLNKDDDKAFERLGAIEAFKGNFREAEERFLKSIDIADNVAAYRVELAKVYLQTDEAKKAWYQLKKALEAEPYNPKYLDYFLETSILVGDMEAAEEALNALEAANPENQKLEDFRERIKNITPS